MSLCGSGHCGRSRWLFSGWALHRTAPNSTVLLGIFLSRRWEGRVRQNHAHQGKTQRDEPTGKVKASALHMPLVKIFLPTCPPHGYCMHENKDVSALKVAFVYFGLSPPRRGQLRVRGPFSKSKGQNMRYTSDDK